jgi:hypothetical protein
MPAVIKKRFYHNGYKVVVFCKEDGGQLVPLKFDIYFNSTKINWRLSWKQIKMFNEAIYDELNFKSQYN